MDINVNLQDANNFGTGISLFANEMIGQLAGVSEYNLYGCFNFVRGIKSSDIKRFPFEVKYSCIPYKLIYSRTIRGKLPFDYHKMMGNYADLNLFFSYRIPRVNYKGVTIATIHGLIPLRVSVESPSLKDNYINDIEYSIKHADHIITVSESSKRDIITEFDYPEDKVTVVPNGVDYDRFSQTFDDGYLSDVMNKYKLPQRFILYMGGIRKHKNVSSIIKAYSLLSNELKSEVSLVITQGSVELFQLVEELGLKDNVVFTSFIDEGDKPALYRLAQVMVFVSLYEGFGLPILEAMAAGVPVITSNISSMPEVAGGAAILVSPLDIEEISLSIEKVLNDSNLRLHIVKLGYDNARRYSWENAGRKMVELCSKYSY